MTQAVAPDSLAGLVGMAGQLPLSEDGGDAFRGHAVQVQMKLGDPLGRGSRLGRRLSGPRRARARATARAAPGWR